MHLHAIAQLRGYLNIAHPNQVQLEVAGIHQLRAVDDAPKHAVIVPPAQPQPCQPLSGFGLFPTTDFMQCEHPRRFVEIDVLAQAEMKRDGWMSSDAAFVLFARQHS